MERSDKVKTTKLIPWTTQCIAIQKCEDFFFSWVETPIVMLWNVVAPSTLKQTTLIIDSWSLFSVQLFITPSKFTKIGILLKSLTTKTCTKIHDWLSILITSLQLTLMNFIVWMVIFVVTKTILFMDSTMPQPLVYVQWLLRLVRVPNHLARTNYVTNLHITMFKDK